MWNSTSPGVATACREPARISRNGCSPAGRGPARRAGPRPRHRSRSRSSAVRPGRGIRPRGPGRPGRRTARAPRRRCPSSGLTTTTRKIAAPVSGAITACGSGPAASASGVTRPSSPSRPRRRGGPALPNRAGLCAEPAGDVEAETAVRGHDAQAVLQLAEPLGAERAGPLCAQVLEDRGRPDQRVDTARGEPDQLAPAVGGVGGALGVAQVSPAGRPSSRQPAWRRRAGARVRSRSRRAGRSPASRSRRRAARPGGPARQARRAASSMSARKPANNSSGSSKPAVCPAAPALPI